MSTPKDIQILKVVATLKTAIELGNATDATAEVAKLMAMVSTGIAVESVVRVYTGLNGLGLALSEWRLGRAVSGNEVDITRTSFVAGQVAAQIVGLGIDWAREWNIGGNLYELLHQEGSSEFLSPIISNSIGTTPDPLVRTIKYVPWSAPLVLDLNGDGLEITPLSKGVLFDTNGDLIKSGTAWISADDGLVVRDINGNGVIDSGRELFGDETILTSGPNAESQAALHFFINVNAPYSVASHAIQSCPAVRSDVKNTPYTAQKQPLQCDCRRSRTKTPSAIPVRVTGHKGPRTPMNSACATFGFQPRLKIQPTTVTLNPFGGTQRHRDRSWSPSSTWPRTRLHGLATGK